MSKDWVSDVEDFHFLFEVYTPPKGEAKLPPNSIQLLRKELITEEYKEFLEASKSKNLVLISDSLVDMIYVIIGAALSYGIPIDAIWNEVHRTNMLKINGKKSKTGKILKPKGWKPPDIKGILNLD